MARVYVLVPDHRLLQHNETLSLLAIGFCTSQQATRCQDYSILERLSQSDDHAKCKYLEIWIDFTSGDWWGFWMLLVCTGGYHQLLSNPSDDNSYNRPSSRRWWWCIRPCLCWLYFKLIFWMPGLMQFSLHSRYRWGQTHTFTSWPVLCWQEIFTQLAAPLWTMVGSEIGDPQR